METLRTTPITPGLITPTDKARNYAQLLLELLNSVSPHGKNIPDNAFIEKWESYFVGNQSVYPHWLLYAAAEKMSVTGSHTFRPQPHELFDTCDEIALVDASSPSHPLHEQVQELRSTLATDRRKVAKSRDWKNALTETTTES